MAYGLLSIGQTNPSFDRNGRAVTAELRWYVNNTNTPATVYQDEAGLTPHDFPITSDANGVFPLVYGDDETLYGLAWNTLESDPQERRWNDINVATSANQTILTLTEAARDDAQEIADDLGDLETALATAETAAATATTQAGIATTQAGNASTSASAAAASAVTAEFWAGQAEAAAGGDFQASNANLTAIAGLTLADNKIIVGTGAAAVEVLDYSTVAQTLNAQTSQANMRTTGLGMSANGSSLVSAADYAAMRTALSLVPGTNVQAYSSVLATLAGASANGQSLVTAADYAAMRTLLGLVELSNSELWTGSDAIKVLTAARLFAASASVAVSYSSSITLDGNTGFNFHTTLTGNLTLANPTNFKAGQSGRIRLTQDGTGSRTLTLGSQWDCVGGAPTLSTGAGAVDVLTYFVHTTSLIECSLGKGLA